MSESTRCTRLCGAADGGRKDASFWLGFTFPPTTGERGARAAWRPRYLDVGVVRHERTSVENDRFRDSSEPTSAALVHPKLGSLVSASKTLDIQPCWSGESASELWANALGTAYCGARRVGG
jgi:hypothetical protein